MLGRYRLIDIFILEHLMCGLDKEQLENTFGDDERENAFSITGCMANRCWCRLHRGRKRCREQCSISLIFKDVNKILNMRLDSGYLAYQSVLLAQYQP